MPSYVVVVKHNMRQGDALREATRLLRRARVDSPSLDATLLLAHATGQTKESILAHPETLLTPTEVRRFLRLIKRRAKHEPLAYITNHREFYGLDFLVNRHVLIPRPETELLVEAALARTQKTEPKKQLTIVDVGTGSGVIIIALAKRLQSADYRLQFFATDNSMAALRVARANARRHGIKITFKKGNLFEPIRKLVNSQIRTLIITANLPYLPTREWRATAPEVRRYEPRGALDGGPDGLKYYRQLIAELKKFESGIRNQELWIFLEFCPEQATAITKLVRGAFPRAAIEIKKDLAGRKRLLTAIL